MITRVSTIPLGADVVIEFCKSKLNDLNDEYEAAIDRSGIQNATVALAPGIIKVERLLTFAQVAKQMNTKVIVHGDLALDLL